MILTTNHEKDLHDNSIDHHDAPVLCSVIRAEQESRKGLGIEDEG